MSQTKVLLVDDHLIVTQGLRLILQGADDLAVVGDASNGREALEFIASSHVDLVLMDVSMPEMDGREASAIIREKFPHIKILILTSYNHKKLIQELIKLGVHGCLLKDQSGERLLEAIERVMGGKSYYDDEKSFDQEADQHILGDRETEVLRLFSLDNTYQEIADEMGVSKLTVKTHLRNIRRKLQIEKATDLMQFAINQGLI